MTTQTHQASLVNHNPDNYQKHANFVYKADFTKPVLDLLNAQPGERIIDLGCGTGELTHFISQAVGEQGEVWAVDSSESMLEKARDEIGGHGRRVTFVRADIQGLAGTLDSALGGTFDAVFSSATFHWCKADPGGVIDGVRWLLKPGGRLAFEMGGFGNTVGVRGAIHQVLRRHGVDPVPLDPWYFPTVSQYTAVLSSHGMTPADVQLVPRPSPLSTDLRGWLQTFVRNTFLASFDDEMAGRFMAEIVEICRIDAYWSLNHSGIGVGPAETGLDAQKPSTDGWEVMYVRLRGVAHRTVDDT